MLRLPPFAQGQRIGLFGGSFNPAHRGHVQVAEFALKRLQLDCVWWLVSPQNPLKDVHETGDYDLRFKSTTAIASNPCFVVTDLERQIDSRNTAQTLRALAPALRRAKFVWIMGADSLKGFHRWHDWAVIARTLPMAVLARPGYSIGALRSKTALRFDRYRLRPELSGLLADCAPPAWVFISMPLRHESSTAIRHQRIEVSHR